MESLAPLLAALLGTLVDRLLAAIGAVLDNRQKARDRARLAELEAALVSEAARKAESARISAGLRTLEGSDRSSCRDGLSDNG